MGMNFTYMDGNGKEVKGQSSLKFKPLKSLFNALVKQEFVLDDDDFLTEIYGFVGDTINQIGFITYKGKQEKFGEGKGMYFSIHFPCHTFTAAKGGYA